MSVLLSLSLSDLIARRQLRFDRARGTLTILVVSHVVALVVVVVVVVVASAPDDRDTRATAKRATQRDKRVRSDRHRTRLPPRRRR